jgi:hypothetical protein
MINSLSIRHAIQFALMLGITAVAGSLAVAADLDPKAISITLPENIKWVANNNGGESAVLVGDPSKPGLYVVLTKWKAHHNSRPHFHPNDRFITVLSGTWWVNTGPKYDPDGMKPVPAGSFVTHYGKEIHYDGAKDGDAILQIVGIGPATSTSAETK